MKKRELFTFAESLLFIVGAVLLVFNVATGRGIWFFMGLSLAAIAVVMWVTVFTVEKTKKQVKRIE